MGCLLTTPSIWPPAAAFHRPEMAAEAGSQPTGARRPLVEVLVTAGCPHREAAITLARRVCQQRGGRAEVRVVEVPDQPAAEQARFLGSPTIRVDGRDIEPGAERSAEFVHGCRLYQGAHSLHGLPEEDWLHVALQEAQV
jgi:hypothetical protein